MTIEASNGDSDDDCNDNMNNDILAKVNENNAETSVQNQYIEVVENVFDSKRLHQEEDEDVQSKELEWSIYLAKI